MEKQSLQFQPPTVTAQFTAGSHYPVTRNDNRERVSAQSLPCGPRCWRFTHLLRHPGVASGLAVGDKPGFFPYCALKGGGGGEVKLIRKVYPVTAEVEPEALL